ncbi:hypothetical protein BB558_002463 [Smittium angustum]|uniref:Threonine/serine exporter-like N-terminal domain-containing protein n=1 Tax=Smittium angustum TaxID=133377 RepID=A0A2U1J907_SMIAN|nr:hypothetical protein BB558_002463 [Smittium angustum]
MSNPKNFKSSKLNPHAKPNKEDNDTEANPSSTYSFGSILTSITGKKQNKNNAGLEELKTETLENIDTNIPSLSVETKLGEIPVRKLASNTSVKASRLDNRKGSTNTQTSSTKPFRQVAQSKARILSSPSISKIKKYEQDKLKIAGTPSSKNSEIPGSKSASIFGQNIKLNLYPKNKESSRLERAGGKKFAEARIRSDSQAKIDEDIEFGMENELEFAIPLAMQIISQSRKNSPSGSRRTSIFGVNNDLNTNPLTNEKKNPNDSPSLIPKDYNQTTFTNKLHSRLIDVEKSANHSREHSAASSTFDHSEQYKKFSTYSKSQKLVIELCRCLGNFGSPSYRLELSLDRMAKFLGVNASFKSFPGLSEISVIESMAPLYPAWLRMICNSLSCTCFAIIAFNGGWKEGALSFLLGLVLQLLDIFSTKFEGFKNLYHFASSFLVGFVAASLSKYVCFGSVTLASLFNLLPGLGLTIGVMELMARSIITGTVYVFYSLAITMTLSFGIQTGSSVSNAIRFGNLNSELDLNSTCSGLSSYYQFIFFPLVMLFTLLSMNIPKKRWFVSTTIACSMYSVFWMFSNRLSLGYFSTVTSSFIAGCLSNLCGRFLEIPPFVPLLPSITMLVPGSVGVRSISNLFAGESSSELIMRMITSCLSIMVGLFGASFVVYPKDKTKTALITF